MTRHGGARGRFRCTRCHLVYDCGRHLREHRASMHPGERGYRALPGPQRRSPAEG